MLGTSHVFSQVEAFYTETGVGLSRLSLFHRVTLDSRRLVGGFILCALIETSIFDVMRKFGFSRDLPLS